MSSPLPMQGYYELEGYNVTDLQEESRGQKWLQNTQCLYSQYSLDFLPKV